MNRKYYLFPFNSNEQNRKEFRHYENSLTRDINLLQIRVIIET